ncbi:MAG: hypothetical protein ABEK04_01870 [Candidatus Nanohalobium sp.]
MRKSVSLRINQELAPQRALGGYWISASNKFRVVENDPEDGERRCRNRSIGSRER